MADLQEQEVDPYSSVVVQEIIENSRVKKAKCFSRFPFPQRRTQRRKGRDLNNDLLI